VCTTDAQQAAFSNATTLVYKNIVGQAMESEDYFSKKLGPELIHDPCMPRTSQTSCGKCGHDEVLYFTPSDENMKLRFICCDESCCHMWWGATEEAVFAPTIDEDVKA
jgi:hypothetical protein